MFVGISIGFWGEAVAKVVVASLGCGVELTNLSSMVSGLTYSWSGLGALSVSVLSFVGGVWEILLSSNSLSL